MGQWAVTQQPPITVPLTSSGETTILPALADPNTIYRLYAIQFVNKGKAREVELKEGIFVRWRGQIPQNAEITVDYGAGGWTFANNTPLIVNAIGTPKMDVNVLTYGTVLTTI